MWLWQVSQQDNEDSQGIPMNGKPTRDRLIDIGLELMHRHGYNATGVAEILKEAGLPKGSFYHHFANKEDFAAAALEKYVAREGEHAARVLNAPNILPLKRLRHYFEDLVKIYGQSGSIPGCMLGRFSLDMASQNSQLRKRIGASFDRWQHTIAVVIGEAVARKELPSKTDPERLAGFLLNSWQGALVRSQAQKSDAPLTIFTHFAFEFLLKPD
jgi:TetR/AcrR family transcriptional regulator, transcriptional repressor for nem operon